MQIPVGPSINSRRQGIPGVEEKSVSRILKSAPHELQLSRDVPLAIVREWCFPNAAQGELPLYVPFWALPFDELR